jgi:alpha-L-arabinofuranosidase
MKLTLTHVGVRSGTKDGFDALAQVYLARIRLTSGNIVEGRGSVLTHADMTASNTFDHPNEVRLSPFPVDVRGNRADISIPQRAVVSLELKMA